MALRLTQKQIRRIVREAFNEKMGRGECTAGDLKRELQYLPVDAPVVIVSKNGAERLLHVSEVAVHFVKANDNDSDEDAIESLCIYV